MKSVSAIVLTVTLLSVSGLCQVAPKPGDTRNGGLIFATNQAFSKGGIGIVNTSLYIDVKSARNELILNDGRWTGRAAETSELVIVFENKIWSTESVPGGFDLSKAIVVSFEGSIVRFFDFAKMSGGYYKRLPHRQ